MNLNGSNIYISKDDRNTLKRFFVNNIKWIKNNNLLDYDDIKTFGDMYEKFIDENNLRNNDILMLFLVEIRYEQLVCRITKDTIQMRMAKMSKLDSSCGIHIKNATILKWYRESMIVEYISPVDVAELDRSLEPKLKQNTLERQRSWETAAKKIVK